MKHILLCISLLLMPAIQAMQKQMPRAAAAEYAGAGAGAGTATAQAIPLAAGEKKQPAATAATRDEDSIRQTVAIDIKPIDFGERLTGLIAAHRALTPVQQTAAAPAFWPKVEVLLRQVRASHADITAAQKDEINALTVENNELAAQVEKLQKAASSDLPKNLAELTELIRVTKEKEQKKAVAATATAQEAHSAEAKRANDARNSELKGAAKLAGLAAIGLCLREMYKKGFFRKLKCEIL